MHLVWNVAVTEVFMHSAFQSIKKRFQRAIKESPWVGKRSSEQYVVF